MSVFSTCQEVDLLMCLNSSAISTSKIQEAAHVKGLGHLELGQVGDAAAEASNPCSTIFPAPAALSPPSPTSPGSYKHQTSWQTRACRVPGCTQPLQHGYCQNYRICRAHKNADTFTVGGQAVRYCQQCGKIHSRDAFEPGRQSCRASLLRHQRNRQLRMNREGGPPGAVSPRLKQLRSSPPKKRRYDDRQEQQQQDEPAPASKKAAAASPQLPPAIGKGGCASPSRAAASPTGGRSPLASRSPQQNAEQALPPPPAAQLPQQRSGSQVPLSPLTPLTQWVPTACAAAAGEIPQLSPRVDLVRQAILLLDDDGDEPGEVPSKEAMLSWNERLGFDLRPRSPPSSPPHCPPPPTCPFPASPMAAPPGRPVLSPATACPPLSAGSGPEMQAGVVPPEQRQQGSNCPLESTVVPVHAEAQQQIAAYESHEPLQATCHTERGTHQLSYVAPGPSGPSQPLSPSGPFLFTSPFCSQMQHACIPECLPAADCACCPNAFAATCRPGEAGEVLGCAAQWQQGMVRLESAHSGVTAALLSHGSSAQHDCSLAVDGSYPRSFPGPSTTVFLLQTAAVQEFL